MTSLARADGFDVENWELAENCFEALIRLESPLSGLQDEKC